MFKASAYPIGLNPDPLQELVGDALRCLRNHIVKIDYPTSLGRGHTLSDWKQVYKSADLMNRQVLSAIDGRGGVYALLVRKPNLDWQLKYIGQAKESVSKQRLRSHVIWRNKETPSGRFTGSKFDEVRLAVSQGHEIGISFVEIRPSSLRHYVEETLITKKNPQWNFNGVIVAKQRASVRHCVL